MSIETTTPQVSDGNEFGARSGAPEGSTETPTTPAPTQAQTGSAPNNGPLPDPMALVGDWLWDMDGRLLRGIKADRNRLLSLVHRDISRAHEVTVDEGSDLLASAYYKAMDSVAFLRARLEQIGSASDQYAGAKTLFEQALVQLLQIRAAQAQRDGELGSSGSTTG